MIITARAKFKGVSPYSQSRYYSVPKLERELDKDYEARTWRNRLHVQRNGEVGNDPGKVFIPPMAFKNCIAEAAKFLSIKIPGKGKQTYTKNFKAGVMVVDPLILPDNPEEVEGEWLFVPSDGVPGSGKRVEKCFPVVREWEGEVEFLILDPVITEDVFREVLTTAGRLIGLGRFRPINNGFYGRFELIELIWIEA